MIFLIYYIRINYFVFNSNFTYKYLKMINRKLIDRFVDIFLILFLLISTLSAITYFSSENIFDTKISYINDLKLPYSVILEIENYNLESQDFEIEIINVNQNLVVGSKTISCSGICEVKVDIKKVFFDEHTIEIKSKINGKFYSKELEFNLVERKTNNNVIFRNNYFIKNWEVPIIEGKLFIENPSKVRVVTFPKKNSQFKSESEFFCPNECNFNLSLNSNILFGEYEVQVYLQNDVIESNFNLVDFSQKNNLSTLNINKNLSNEIIKINVSNKTTTVNAKNLLGEIVELQVENGSVDSTGIESILIDGKRGIETKINTIQLNSVDSLSEINSISNESIIILKNETIVINSTRIIEKKGFIDIGNLDLTKQSNVQDPNPIIMEEEKIYFNEGNSFIDVNSNETNLSKSVNKLVPGIYKQEKVQRFKDGSSITQEVFFAYGLVSVNTLKPLYHKNELTNFLIVVLDKRGYLVSNATIEMTIIKPNNDSILLTTDNFEIVETNKTGVYSTSYFSDEVGEYILDVKTKVENILIDVNSYYNVVDEYAFDIIRDVPATIDPWEGPFRNEFEITPLNNFRGEYDFIEQFSSDFEIIETDANKIETIGDTTYLRWNKLNRISKPYYVAQVPLKTPYLYFLGKSKIIYDYKVFNENRSWLFAIDPAAKVCTFESPCICGAACSGGNEAGDGTIDTCSDGTTTYEFVNDIRVTALNSSYFGVGDTVEVCMDFQCDSSSTGDRVTFAYKNGGVAWADSHVYNELQCDNNNLNTQCYNVVLDNYVGKHHFRGKLVWSFSSEAANSICSTSTYRDHDDIEIDVLDKLAPTQISWDLDNGTTIGNNLNVIRGSEIRIFSNWDLPLQEGTITHDSVGSFIQYSVDSYANNQTNYTFNTLNTTLFPNLGIISTNLMQANDFYFNLTGSSSGTRDFTMFAEIKLNESTLVPNVGYEGINTTMSCQFIDSNILSETYAGLNISFYKNSTLLGTNLTDINGWAQYGFQENVVGNYNITCNTSTNLSNYIIATPFVSSSKELIVRINGTDIVTPIITNVSATPNLFSIGGVTIISANVTDDVKVDSVQVFVTLPNTTILSYPMVNVGTDIYNFTFNQTTLDGNYGYYIYALDNSSNPTYSSTKNFEVTGVRSFIGIQSTQNIFKLGDSLNLTKFSKVSSINTTIYSEVGDVDHIYYSFDSSGDGWTHSGTLDEWGWGVPSTVDLNVCQSGSCWVTDLVANYNDNANNNIQSPILDMTGRTSAKVSFWKEITFPSGVNDKIYFESFDGVSWNKLYENTIGANNQEGAFSTYYPSEIEGISNARFRFSMTSDGSTNDEGFLFDSLNLSFDPRPDWNKNWSIINSSFGLNVSKLTAIKIKLNVTNYVSTGSDSAGNPSPDIELKLYNGTAYSTSKFCNLDSTKTYPYTCDFIIKNTPEYLNSWNDSVNRNIQFRVINIDSGDNVTFTDITREIITPSIVENNGIGQMTAYLLEQFKNSTGGVVSTLSFSSISINPGEAKELSDYWTYSIAGNFQLGNYSAYVAITDADGNVLQNEDDGSYINDSYDFQIQSLIINPIVPIWDDVLPETFILNISLDETSYASGGSCKWYSSFTGVNLTMTASGISNYIYPISDIADNNYSIIFYCNDSDGDWVDTGLINFNISENPRINFSVPTDLNNSFVDRSWSQINVSINDSSFNYSWLEFNSNNYSMSCSGLFPYFNCGYNISNLLNGLYSYRVCANDSLNNFNCTGFQNININKTLPTITINSPSNNSKFIGSDIIDFNVSVNEIATNLGGNIYLEFNSNGTKYQLSNTTLNNWTYSSSFITGIYSILFSGNDSIGNNFNSSEQFFTVMPDKSIQVKKSISYGINSNNYNSSLILINGGKWTNHSVFDFIDSNFIYGSISISPDLIESGFGFIFVGDSLRWDISLPYSSSQLITYNFNGSNDYSLKNNYLIGVE